MREERNTSEMEKFSRVICVQKSLHETNILDDVVMLENLEKQNRY